MKNSQLEHIMFLFHSESQETMFNFSQVYTDQSLLL